MFIELHITLAGRYKLYWTRAGQSTYIVDRIVFNKIKALLGGRMRFAITGGAPLSPETHDFIRVCLGITLVQERITII
jgi:long-chain acyl-CoA synthetase